MAPPLPPLACDGCRKCCLGDTITFLPGDNPLRYKTSMAGGRLQLAKGADGNCVYLGERGCTIQDTKPRMCREFDCRAYAWNVAHKGTPRERAERAGKPTIVEGTARLRALGVVLPAPTCAARAG